MIDIPDFLDIKLIFIYVFAICLTTFLIALITMKMKKSVHIKLFKLSSIISIIACFSIPILIVLNFVVNTQKVSEAIEKNYNVKVMDLSLNNQKTTIIYNEKYLDCEFYKVNETKLGVSCLYDGKNYYLNDIQKFPN